MSNDVTPVCFDSIEISKGISELSDGLFASAPFAIDLFTIS